MEFTHRFFAHPLFNRLQSRVSALSKRGLRVHPRFRRPLTGTAFLMASLILGRWAMEQSEAAARRDWELNHSPAPRVWNFMAETYGLKPLSSGDPKHRAVRSLPIGVDDLDSVWWNATPTGIWIAVFERKLGNESPAFFGSANETQMKLKRETSSRTASSGGLPDPKAWIRLGVGWEGFQTASEKLDEHERSRRTAAVPKPLRKPPSDPRLIQY